MTNKLIDLLGKRFGNYTVIDRAPSRGARAKTYWRCKCDCGDFSEVEAYTLKSGRSTSCIKCCRSRYQWQGVGQLSKTYWGRLLAGARKRDLPFTITIKEAWKLFLKQNGKCAISGESLQFGRFNSKQKSSEINQTASLDRIDSNKGYTSDNIRWVHKDINRMKSTFTDEQLLYWVKAITNGPLNK